MSDIKNGLLSMFQDSLVSFASGATRAVFFLIIYFAIYRILKKIVLKCLSKITLDESAIKFISSLLNVIGLVVVCLVILSIFNFPVSSIVAIFTAIAVGVGISFKESLGNLGAGMILLWSKQFRTGDYISSAGLEGTVHSMSAFTVMLKTIDNKVVTIPNSKLINDNIINFSAQKTRRIEISILIPYGESVEKVKKILVEILDGNEDILKSPEYLIGVRTLSENGIEFFVAPWVENENYWKVYYEIMDEVVKQFSLNGIQAPYSPVQIVNNKKHSF